MIEPRRAARKKAEREARIVGLPHIRRFAEREGVTERGMRKLAPPAPRPAHA